MEQGVSKMTESVRGSRTEGKSTQKDKGRLLLAGHSKRCRVWSVGARGPRICTAWRRCPCHRARESVKPSTADLCYKSPGTKWHVSTGSICCTSAGTQHTPSFPHTVHECVNVCVCVRLHKVSSRSDCCSREEKGEARKKKSSRWETETDSCVGYRHSSNDQSRPCIS